MELWEFVLRLLFIILACTMYFLIGKNVWWGWTQRENDEEKADLSKVEVYGPSFLFFGLWVGKWWQTFILFTIHKGIKFTFFFQPSQVGQIGFSESEDPI